MHAPVEGHIVRRRPYADRLCASGRSWAQPPRAQFLSQMPCQLLIKPLISIAQQAPETETPILAMAIARIAAVHEPSVNMQLSEFIPNLSRAEP